MNSSVLHSRSQLTLQTSQLKLSAPSGIFSKADKSHCILVKEKKRVHKIIHFPSYVLPSSGVGGTDITKLDVGVSDRGAGG